MDGKWVQCSPDVLGCSMPSHSHSKSHWEPSEGLSKCCALPPLELICSLACGAEGKASRNLGSMYTHKTCSYTFQYSGMSALLALRSGNPCAHTLVGPCHNLTPDLVCWDREVLNVLRFETRPGAYARCLTCPGQGNMYCVHAHMIPEARLCRQPCMM